MTSQPNPILLALPIALRQARQHAGLSQTALAERMDLAPQHISRWEHGHNDPTTVNVLRFAEATGIPASKIFQRAERIAARTASLTAHDHSQTPGKAA